MPKLSIAEKMFEILTENDVAAKRLDAKGRRFLDAFAHAVTGTREETLFTFPDGSQIATSGKTFFVAVSKAGAR